MSSIRFFFIAHKWVGIIAALVLTVCAGTGFLLLIKKEVAWVQPPERAGAAPNTLSVTFDDILRACVGDERLGIKGWGDVRRVDVRPRAGIAKVITRDGMEAQVDLSTGELLQVAERRSDLIESIHDGSFFGEWAHGYLWPLASVSLLFLVFSGLWLWLLPKVRRARRRTPKPAN